ncbi:hypothetical protein C8R45DRAFT_933911 [Mycena sanguinolenta]|nr:hypothetical protein C8R45DRAFT_933911 [Mycena sanguinolenta]
MHARRRSKIESDSVKTSRVRGVNANTNTGLRLDAEVIVVGVFACAFLESDGGRGKQKAHADINGSAMVHCLNTATPSLLSASPTTWFRHQTLDAAPKKRRYTLDSILPVMGHRALTALVLNQSTSEITLPLSFLPFRVFKRLVDILEINNQINGTLWPTPPHPNYAQENDDPDSEARLLAQLLTSSSLEKLVDNSSAPKTTSVFGLKTIQALTSAQKSISIPTFDTYFFYQY